MLDAAIGVEHSLRGPASGRMSGEDPDHLVVEVPVGVHAGPIPSAAGKGQAVQKYNYSPGGPEVSDPTPGSSDGGGAALPR